MILHWQLVQGSVVIDVFEGVQPHFSALLAAGQNPYVVSNQPLYTNAYPPLYNALCAILLPFFDNSLSLHRGVTGLFIVLSCALIFVTARRATSDTILASLAAVLLYAALQFYSTVVASSNSMGTFFFLATVLVPWHCRFSVSSLLASLIFALAAFFSKQYFALGLLIVASYLMLFVSVKAGLVYGFLGGISLLTCLAIADHMAPFFLENILFAMGNVVDAIDNNSSTIDQLWFFTKYYSGLIIATVITLSLPFFTSQSPPSLDTPNTGSALLKNTRIDYFLFAFLLSLATIVFVLGRNPGNYMTYLFQLMSPFLLLYLVGLLASRTNSIFLAPLLMINLYVAFATLPSETEPNLTQWQKAYKHIRMHDNILNSSILTYALMTEGKKVNNGGLDSMFRYSTIEQTPLQSEERRQRALDVWNGYKDQVRSGVMEQRYDALMIQPGEMNHLILTEADRQGKGSAGRFLRRYYTLADSFELSLTDRLGGGIFPIQVWLPKQ